MKKAPQKSKSLAIILILFSLMMNASVVQAQKKNKDEEKSDKSFMSSSNFSSIKFRGVGPAFASGRISDIVVDPCNNSVWYVGVACGSIWKTVNNGTTFKPIFDKYNSYSIGCLAMDPKDSNIIWAGTGENNHQRALSYGDGVYKSTDGGRTWLNVGLKESRHIGMIAIHPKNTNTVFVAAEGSAWGPGGDRGLYKTTDGGKNWNKVLNISENTGINNVIINPQNPDIMYATSEQRRRHVHTKIGGGPESGIHKSTDGGKTWKKLTSGLPKGHVGGIGIDISPVSPNIVYAIIEAEGKKGGFFRTTDTGKTWKKMSDHVSSGQYYNEIFCDPTDADKVYSVETISKYTNDGGKTWKSLSNNKRHVDDHALWLNPKNPNHFIIGGDGGVYESYDSGKNYRFVSNLPITQYYRVYVDNDFPFYNVYGGTQDNNSMGGPSQNLSRSGVTSEEWTVTNGGDGFWGAVDPENPDIVYSESQFGNVVRYDKKSGERLFIKPQPKKGEKTYKWNWNTPFIISPHSKTRLYIAANKVFRSDDRGNSWKIISDDLTAKLDRNTWPVMGKYWSSDAVRKDLSTSLFGTIVSMAESPVKENLIYIGTDDGLIQITENAGTEWSKISSFPGVPANTYISDICPSKHNENIVYASFDNRKRDDFKPYIYISKNKGKSWTSISSNLPKNGTVHTIEQDFKNPDLLFVGTEFGVFFSNNGGQKWIQLKSGIPTISIRDMVIQERETDLVAATFGRGFYILENYSPLREVNEDFKSKEAYFFPVKDALSYMQKVSRNRKGSTFFVAKNTEFGAQFTYYLKEVPKSDKSIRKEKEKKLFKDGKPIPQLSLEDKRKEKNEESSYLLFTITDSNDKIIKKITKKASKGIKRMNWNLRYSSYSTVSVKDNKFDPFKKSGSGNLVPSGKYKITMALYNKGEYKKLYGPVEFNVKSLNNTTFPATDKKDIIEFQKKVNRLAISVSYSTNKLEELSKKTLAIKQTILSVPEGTPEMMKEAQRILLEIEDMKYLFNGPQPKASFQELPPHDLCINRRLRYLFYAHRNSTSDITQTEKEQYDIIKEQLVPIIKRIKKLSDADIPRLEKQLNNINAPWTPGR